MRNASALATTRAITAGLSALEAHFRPHVLPPSTWPEWTRELFPNLYSIDFAPHHAEAWEWAERVRPGRRPDPFVGVWPREGGKSSNVEGIVVNLGAKDMRKYCLYVRESQEEADKSVDNLAAMLESPRFAERYPKHADRMVGKYGSSKGWRRNRLRTAGGFTVDALGLDTKVRGRKVEEQRPDLIVLDDVDGKWDTPKATKKKLHTITHTILPAGSRDVAVMVVQNLIIPDGIVSQLVDGRADMLHDRVVSGPHPALVDPVFDTEQLEDGRIKVHVVSGTPTWVGQDRKRCEQLIATIGLRSFLEECQQDVYARQGALWTRDLLDQTRVMERPESFTRVGVGVDPSGGGDDIGIIVGARTKDRHAFIWGDVTQKGAAGPLAWGTAAVDAYWRNDADRVIGETNFGGDLVVSNVTVAAKEYAREHGVSERVVVHKVNASRGKEIRADPVATAQEAGRVHIVGSLPALERELTGWVPNESKWSPNRLDAFVHLVTWLLDLEPVERREVAVYFPGMDDGENGNGNGNGAHPNEPRRIVVGRS